MKRLLVIAALVVSACDAGPLPDVGSPSERADYRKDWFPTNSEDPLPLDVAVQDGNVSAVRRLLEEGANPNARWSQSGDRFPLQEVLEARPFGYRIDDPVELIALLLKHGADSNMKWCPFESRGPSDYARSCNSAKGMTPLMLAALSGRADVVQLLLEAGADATVRNWMGEAALDYADDEIAFEMISRSLFPDLLTRDRNTLEWLNDSIARSSGDRVPLTPLSRALYRSTEPRLETRQLPRIRTLMRIGADPNQRIGQETPLSIAVRYRAYRAAGILLRNGADANQRWCAAAPLPRWDVDMDLELAKRGLAISCTLPAGMTSLMWSAAADDRHAVKMLLEFNADTSLKDWAGRTALDYASTRGMKDVLAAGRGF